MKDLGFGIFGRTALNNVIFSILLIAYCNYIFNK